MSRLFHQPYGNRDLLGESKLKLNLYYLLMSLGPDPTIYFGNDLPC